MSPTLAKAPPLGEEWIHECKFDGWRCQVHIADGEVTLFSKSGADMTRRFRELGPLLLKISVRTAIIDCELVACDEEGMPSFRTLMERRHNNAPLCLWAFDLLHLDGVRLTPLPLIDRRARLAEIIAAVDTPQIQFSGAFDDPFKLLQACDRLGLEGIVSKLAKSAYRSGPTKDWLKYKTASWRAQNRERFALFNRQAH